MQIPKDMFFAFMKAEGIDSMPGEVAAQFVTEQLWELYQACQQIESYEDSTDSKESN